MNEPEKLDTVRGENAGTLPQKYVEYREQLTLLEQQAQTDFDKTVVTLSGGALGVSFTFLDKFLRGQSPKSAGVLVAAWTLWALSLTLVLASHFLSTLAMRKAIKQVDAGKIGAEIPGGAFDTLIKWANALGGIVFVAGVCAMGYFVYANL